MEPPWYKCGVQQPGGLIFVPCFVQIWARSGHCVLGWRDGDAQPKLRRGGRGSLTSRRSRMSKHRFPCRASEALTQMGASASHTCMRGELRAMR
jgi:hypothetical protein